MTLFHFLVIKKILYRKSSIFSESFEKFLKEIEKHYQIYSN